VFKTKQIEKCIPKFKNRGKMENLKGEKEVWRVE
jgi:hypothetical protein